MGVLMNPDILNTIVNTCDVKWHITSVMRLVCKDWKRIVSHVTPSLLDLCVPPRELLLRDYKYEFIREMNDQQYYSWAVHYFGSRSTKTQLANFILCLPAAKVRELNFNNDRNVAMMETKVAITKCLKFMGGVAGLIKRRYDKIYGRRLKKITVTRTHKHQSQLECMKRQLSDPAYELYTLSDSKKRKLIDIVKML